MKNEESLLFFPEIAVDLSKFLYIRSVFFFQFLRTCNHAIILLKVYYPPLEPVERDRHLKSHEKTIRFIFHFIFIFFSIFS